MSHTRVYLSLHPCGSGCFVNAESWPSLWPGQGQPGMCYWPQACSRTSSVGVLLCNLEHHCPPPAGYPLAPKPLCVYLGGARCPDRVLMLAGDKSKCLLHPVVKGRSEVSLTGHRAGASVSEPACSEYHPGWPWIAATGGGSEHCWALSPARRSQVCDQPHFPRPFESGLLPLNLGGKWGLGTLSCQAWPPPPGCTWQDNRLLLLPV